MMRLVLTMLFGAFSMTLFACSKPADTNGMAGDGSEAAAEMVEAVADASAPACVKLVAEGAFCVRDINACGHSSNCSCDIGYNYNAALGMCVLNIDGVASATTTEVSDSECVTAPPAGATCYRDINVCQHPSYCSCQDGFAWNQVVGKCVKSL